MVGIYVTSHTKTYTNGYPLKRLKPFGIRYNHFNILNISLTRSTICSLLNACHFNGKRHPLNSYHKALASLIR